MTNFDEEFTNEKPVRFFLRVGYLEFQTKIKVLTPPRERRAILTEENQSRFREFNYIAP